MKPVHSVFTTLLSFSLLAFPFTAHAAATGAMPDTLVIGQVPHWYVYGAKPNRSVVITMEQTQGSKTWNFVGTANANGTATFGFYGCGSYGTLTDCPWAAVDEGPWAAYLSNDGTLAETVHFTVVKPAVQPPPNPGGPQNVPALPPAPLAALTACLGAFGVFAIRRKHAL